MNANFLLTLLSVECLKPADFPTLSVRDGNFTAATLGQPLVDEMYCRENVSIIDQGAVTRDSIVRSRNRAICHKAGNTRVAKGSSLA
jgi:hypothetical protein